MSAQTVEPLHGFDGFFQQRLVGEIIADRKQIAMLGVAKVQDGRGQPADKSFSAILSQCSSSAGPRITRLSARSRAKSNASGERGFSQSNGFRTVRYFADDMPGIEHGNLSGPSPGDTCGCA